MSGRSIDRRWVLAAVGGLTLLGLGLRLADFGQTLFADELSTYWIVHGHSLGDVLSSVRSNDEITPPLYFVLSWLTVQLGSGPEWLRLPSLVAGTLTIPLVYLLGAKTVGRIPGLLAAALVALSPFMIFYSTEARSYALMIALVTLSTVALLIALEDGRARWWVVYSLASAGAMLSHYTAAFALAAQFAWVLWAHRAAWRPLLLANLGALACFAPWIPGFIADNNSPTTGILSALSPFTAPAVRAATETWAYGYQYVKPDHLPGDLGRALITAGILLAAGAAALRAARSLRRARPRFSIRQPTATGPVLIGMLALATPLGELIYSALGSNLYTARNLNASWPGLAVAAGALVTAAGPVLGAACAAMLLAGFSIGAVKAVGKDVARPGYEDIAAAVERQAAPGDVVIDAAAMTPVPQTALDLYLPPTHPEFRLGLPHVDHPFNVFDRAPDTRRQIAAAFRRAGGRPVYVVTLERGKSLPNPETDAIAVLRLARRDLAAQVRNGIPPGYRIVSSEAVRGLLRLRLSVIEKKPG